MSLQRAFTSRKAKQPSLDMGSAPHRSNTVSRGHGNMGSIRHKISAPMELLNATNMLAYHAPDLYPKSATSTTSTSSTKSDDDSDSAPTSASSPPTSPDISKEEDKTVAEPNHLSCYFTAPGQKLPANAADVPKIPQRAPSHTKQASHDSAASRSARLSNHSSHSVSTKASSTLSRSSSTSTTATSVSSLSVARKPSIPSIPAVPSVPAVTTVVSPPPVRSNPSFRKPVERQETQQHPFGNELAQVTEIAEDFGVKDKMNIIDEEEQALIAKGLCKIRADEYLSEIQGLFSTFFQPLQPQHQPAPQAMWI